MTSTVRATFVSLRSGDGSTVLRCRETGTRYSFNADRLSFPIWREGEIACYRRDVNGALAFIESDARWQIREEQRIERTQLVQFPCRKSSRRFYGHSL